MTKHYNTSIAEDALRILNSKQGDFMSDEVAGPVATIPILRCANTVKATTSTGTSGTLWTTPSDKDFYLLYAEFSIVKDAACDIPTAGGPLLQAFVDGVALPLHRIPVITLTAQNQTATFSLPYPGLKIDRNTAISHSRSATTAGNIVMSSVIIGYTVETTR